MTNNNLPDFWNLYCEAERFLSTLPQTMNNLDIYDKIYHDREEERQNFMDTMNMILMTLIMVTSLINII